MTATIISWLFTGRCIIGDLENSNKYGLPEDSESDDEDIPDDYYKDNQLLNYVEQRKIEQLYRFRCNFVYNYNDYLLFWI